MNDLIFKDFSQMFYTFHISYQNYDMLLEDIFTHGTRRIIPDKLSPGELPPIRLAPG